MMKTIARAMTLSLVLPILLASQTALTGRWQGETPSGAQIVLDVKATNTTLTGTLTHNRESAAITDGKVSKNSFTFKANIDGRTDAFTGEVGTDQITLWPDRLGASKAVVLKRATMLIGKWQGETPNGAQLVLDLTASETALTGTLTRNGQAATIADGKVSKNSFTFKATLNDQTEGFTGKLDGDEITVWLDRQGPERAAVLKRVKK